MKILPDKCDDIILKYHLSEDALFLLKNVDAEDETGNSG
jgi:hypothetical protein